MTALPTGWTRASLGEVADTTLGKMLDRGKIRGLPSVPYLRNVNVQWGRIDTHDLLTMELADVDRDRFAVQPGDLLVCEGGEIGRAAIWNGRTEYLAFQKALHRIRSRGTLDLFYLRYLLELYRDDGTLERFATGSTIAHLPQQNLRALPVPLPTLDEQRRIVDILEDHLSRLDAVDVSFVSVRAKVIALRDAISASALFADLTSEAEHRSRVTVGEIADVDSGPAFKSSLFGGPGEGTRLLRGDNIEPGSLRWGRTKSWPDSQLGGFEHLLVAEGDIILAMDRPVVSAGLKLARVTESDTPALLVQRVARIRPRDTVVGDFLYQILSSRQFVHQVLGNQVGTQIPHITLEAIRKFAFLLPEPAVQSEVARHVRAHFESTERVEHDITRASTRSRSLRRSLLASAFSGRLTGRSNDMEMVEEMAGV